jgi:hypothetical protein
MSAGIAGGRKMPTKYERRTKDKLIERIRELEAENEVLMDGIQTAMNNIGVPQAGYPAPVAVAYLILDALLTGDLVADDERTIEILSQELLRLEKREHELEAKLAEHDAYYKKVVNEECASDEVHCTCVPALRDKINQLEAELGEYKRSNDTYYRQIEMWMKLSVSHEADANQLEAKLRSIECAECEKTLLDCECE